MPSGGSISAQLSPLAGLVDSRDRPGGDVTYVAQENIIPQPSPAPILHPGVGEVFEAWVPGVGYLPSSALQETFPEDTLSLAAPAAAMHSR